MLPRSSTPTPAPSGKPEPAATVRGGYELRFTNVSANTYSVRLAKWVNGTMTELGSKAGYAFVNGNSFALVDLGGTVSAWTDTGSGYTQLLSASDSTFDGGKVGVEGSGNITRLNGFRVGALKFPAVSTEAASGVKAGEATLMGIVNPEGLLTTYQFEYGATTAYGNTAPAVPASAGAGTAGVAVGKAIAGLSPGTTYHYRVVALNEGGVGYGSDKTFTTPAAAPSFLSAFGSVGTGNGQFMHPAGIAVGPGGEVWVVDQDNDRVQKFNAAGQYQSSFGTPGTGDGQWQRSVQRGGKHRHRRERQHLDR